MSAYTKTLVVMANSKKCGGRCVAGKELGRDRCGAWVRPTSAERMGELSLADQLLDGGGHPDVLDIVEITFLQPAPCGYQSENHQIAAGVRWVKRARLPSARLRDLVDPCEALWLNGYSSGGGRNDRVPQERLGGVSSSLRLIGPVRVDLQVTEGRRLRARFTHRGAIYDLAVTDPSTVASYAAQPAGWYVVDHAYLCLSLGTLWNGFAYKLVAAVIISTTH